MTTERVFKTGKYVNHIYSEARIAFMRELLTHHKELMDRLPNEELYYDELLGAVAAQLNIAVDEYMTPAELDIFASALTAELYKKRTSIIL